MGYTTNEDIPVAATNRLNSNVESMFFDCSWVLVWSKLIGYNYESKVISVFGGKDACVTGGITGFSLGGVTVIFVCSEFG